MTICFNFVRVGAVVLFVQPINELNRRFLKRSGSMTGRNRYPFVASTVVMRSPGDLKLKPNNPRLHSDKQIAQIGRSIEEFGFAFPVLTNASSEVVAGDARTRAAIKVGLTEIPTICVDHLTEAQQRALAIADNRLTELSKWNDDLLAEEFKALSAIDLDFDLTVTGFDMGEIDFYIENHDTNKNNEDDDTEPEPIADKPVSRPGDLWILDRHRLLTGNALDPSAFDALMGDDKAAMVFIDLPYNVPIDGHVGGLGKTKHREFAMATGEMSRKEFTQFQEDVFRNCVRHTVAGSIHYYCMDWRHSGEILAASQAFYEFKNICVWVKPNAGMGSLYRSQHELIFVFKSGSAPHQNNVQLGRYGRHRINVWEYPSANAFGKTSEEGPLFKSHPTVKPVKLVADAIMDCSSRGEIVLDGFIGSGTTIIAAERTGRRCFGIEIDSLYVDVAVRRWQNYTGLQAVHANSGRTFDAIEADGQHAA